MLNVNDSVIKYEKQISAVNNLEKKLQALDLEIIKHNSFELGAEWVIMYNSEELAKFMWNVPYMMQLSIGEKMVIDEDYLDSTMWLNCVNDTYEVLRKSKKKL